MIAVIPVTSLVCFEMCIVILLVLQIGTTEIQNIYYNLLKLWMVYIMQWLESHKCQTLV